MQLTLVSNRKSSQRTPVKNPLLKDVQGEVILIRSPRGITVCARNSASMTKHAPSWLYSIVYSEAIIAGNVSKKGGRFEFIRKEQAIEVIGKWVFEQIQSCVSL